MLSESDNPLCCFSLNSKGRKITFYITKNNYFKIILILRTFIFLHFVIISMTFKQFFEAI